MKNFTKDGKKKKKKQANNISQEMFIQVETLGKQHYNRDREKTCLISERKLQRQERKWFSENILKRCKKTPGNKKKKKMLSCAWEMKFLKGPENQEG